MIAATVFAAVGKRDHGDRIGRHDAVVAAVLGQVQLVPVGEPGELGRELVLLAQRRVDRHGEAALEDADDLALDAADMVDIDDHPLADAAGDRVISATLPGDMSTVWQGYSCRSSSMKRPSRLTLTRW